MRNYDLYNKLMEVSKLNDENAFNAAARNWVEGVKEAPFEDEKAKEMFLNAKHHACVWRSGAINSRVSKRRMLAEVRKIVDLELPNPYDPNEKDVEEIKEEVKEEPKAEIKEEPKKEVAAEKKEEPIKVLGVVPDAVVKETEDGKGEVEIKMPETKEEPEKHGIFRKKR